MKKVLTPRKKMMTSKIPLVPMAIMKKKPRMVQTIMEQKEEKIVRWTLLDIWYVNEEYKEKAKMFESHI